MIELTLDKSDVQIYPDVELGFTYDGVVQFARTVPKCRGSCEP